MTVVPVPVRVEVPLVAGAFSREGFPLLFGDVDSDVASGLTCPSFPGTVRVTAGVLLFDGP